jgi:hypothetical protein
MVDWLVAQGCYFCKSLVFGLLDANSDGKFLLGKHGILFFHNSLSKKNQKTDGVKQT